MLSFKHRLSYTVMPAELIGRDPSSWFKTILVDKGSSAGVRQGAGVITPYGVVGKVISVSPTTATVLLITDVNSAVDVVVKRTRSRGIIEGFGENSCLLNYVLKADQLQEGDTIVTTGLNNIYPKGMVIGKIQTLSQEKSGFFQSVVVVPAVDFSKLHEVMIVIKEQPPEQP